jgi:hypothetical protein
MSVKGEVMTAQAGELALYDHAMFPALLDQDPLEVKARFARRFQQAETIDDLFDVLEGNNSKGMVGRKLEIADVAWAPYESDAGVIPLAIVSAMDLDTGEALEFATTSDMLVLFIRKAQIIGQLGFKAKITEKKTRSGRTALNFERV